MPQAAGAWLMCLCLLHQHPALGTGGHSTGVCGVEFSSFPTAHGCSGASQGGRPVSLTLMSTVMSLWKGPSTLLLAWSPPGMGFGLPASTCVWGPSCSQTRPALADKILISLLRSPEWDPIFMSELGNELHLSSPFSMRKVSRRSG